MKKHLGTDIDLNDSCSSIALKWVKKSKNSDKNGFIDQFSSFLNVEGVNIGVTSDGIGTKVELAERLNNYKTLGYDLIAMLADDLISNGFIPIGVTNVIDINRLDKNIINNLMEGLYKATKIVDIPILGGEIAELRGRVDGYGDINLNWSGTAIGVLPKDFKFPLNGLDIEKGDKVIVIKSDKFRSNGYTLAKSILTNLYGDSWDKEVYKGKTWGDILLTPSKIYTPLYKAMVENNILPKVGVHITGGGIKNNILRVLKNRYGVKLDNIFNPHEEMTFLQNSGKIDDITAYKNWNMGNGYIFIINSSNIEQFIELATKYNYEVKIGGVIQSDISINVYLNGKKLKI